MKKAVKIILLMAGLVMLTWLAIGFWGRKKEPVVVAAEVKLPRAADSANYKMTDSAVHTLRSGYVVLRMGLGADSKLLAGFNRHNKSYSHCGIVMVENGYPYVYHSIGGEDNPDERLRRDSAWFFFSPVYNSAIAVLKYDMDAAAVRRLDSVVRCWYRRKPLFDMKFDLATDDKLYCSEFVYKAICAAAEDSAYLPISFLGSKRYVAVDNLFLNSHAAFISQMKFK